MTQSRDNIFIPYDASIKEVLQKMDTTYRRLLIVLDRNDQYLSLISIGDVQRFLIKHQNFNAPLSEALRKKVSVSQTGDSEKSIKEKMIKFRSEFMPILNGDGTLNRVIFWEDIFDTNKSIHKGNLNLPTVIMAGGKGTRLRPITHIIPKPLIPVGEKPVMEIIVDHFVSAGCDDFHFSVGYKANMLKAYFNDIPDKKYNVSYFQEDMPMGTAGSLSLIKDKLTTTFFVSNCDVIIEQDYSEIYEYHKSNKNELTAVAFVKDMKIPYGTFDVSENGVLRSLIEKPEFTFLVNAGMYILEPHLLDEIPDNEFFHITHLMEKIIARNGKVGVFPISEGSWVDIGQWKEYQKTLEKYDEQMKFK